METWPVCLMRCKRKLYNISGRSREFSKTLKFNPFCCQESEMSVIAVYGDALDKLGFEMARKANRNAEKRLTKTLNVYDDMAYKNDAKYRKEK